MSVVCLCVPSRGTRKRMDWRLLVKEHIPKTNLFFGLDLEHIFWLYFFLVVWYIGWFSKTNISVLAKQPTVHSVGVSSGSLCAYGCWHCCNCGFYCFLWYYPHRFRDLVVSHARNTIYLPLELLNRQTRRHFECHVYLNIAWKLLKLCSCCRLL